jgi:hypothetical protein
MHIMATNTKVIADHNPPAVTKILAEFIVNHPTFANGGWGVPSSIGLAALWAQHTTKRQALH